MFHCGLSDFCKLAFTVVVYVHKRSATFNASSRKRKLPMSSCSCLSIGSLAHEFFVFPVSHCCLVVRLFYFNYLRLLLKSMNLEFIGNCLNTVHQLQRSEYRLIDISLQIKAKFTTFKSISARRNSLNTSKPKC